MATNDSTSETPLKKCCRCGIEKPATKEHYYAQKHGKYGLMGTCKACKKIEAQLPHNKKRIADYVHQWGQDNKERRNAQRRERRKNNPAQLEYEREWRRNHPEQCRAATRKWVENHSEQVKAYSKDYYARNKEKRLAKLDKWKADNPERVKETEAISRERYRNSERGRFTAKAAKARRRARIQKAEGKVSNQDIAVQFSSQKGKCWWCGKPVNPKDYHVDHRIPLSRGGNNTPENICISCPSCNLRKNDKMPWEWNGRLL